MLNVLEKAITGMRSKLGESLSSIENRYATAGGDELFVGGAQSLQHRQQSRTRGRRNRRSAILQTCGGNRSGFRVRLRHVAIAYNDLDEAQRARKNARKADQLKNKVSERERFAIEAMYYEHVTGEL